MVWSATPSRRQITKTKAGTGVGSVLVVKNLVKLNTVDYVNIRVCIYTQTCLYLYTHMYMCV